MRILSYIGLYKLLESLLNCSSKTLEALAYSFNGNSKTLEWMISRLPAVRKNTHSFNG